MILLALMIAAAQPAESPVEFIQRVYASYDSSRYSPLANPEDVFSSELTAAIDKDSSGDEVGYLDGDPLCDCQDYERISAQVLKVRQANARSATAKVHVTLGPTETRDLKISLQLTPSGWRISDIVGSDRRSLLKELRHANAKR